MTKSKTVYKKNHEYTGTLLLDADSEPVRHFLQSFINSHLLSIFASKNNESETECLYSLERSERSKNEPGATFGLACVADQICGRVGAVLHARFLCLGYFLGGWAVRDFRKERAPSIKILPAT